MAINYENLTDIEIKQDVKYRLENHELHSHKIIYDNLQVTGSICEFETEYLDKIPQNLKAWVKEELEELNRRMVSINEEQLKRIAYIPWKY